MTRLRWGFLAAFLSFGACSTETGTYVVVRVEQGTAPAGITKISLTMALAGQATSRDLENAGVPLTFPLTAAFEIAKEKGDLMVTATAYAGSARVAEGTGNTVVVRDQNSTATVVLGPVGSVTPGLDGGATDALDAAFTDGPVVTDTDGGISIDGLTDVMPIPGVAQLIANRTAVDFGAVLVGMNSPTVSIKITNVGGDVSGALGVSLSGSVAFATANDVCSGKGLQAQASCTTGVVFMPSAAGGATGSLTVTGMPGGKLTIDLAAMGVAPGALKVTPVTNSFAETEKGKVSAEVEFTVANTGGAATGALTVALSGSDAPDFVLGTNTCANAVVGSGGNCKVGVRFSPITDGPKSASVTVMGSPGGTAVASLDGKASAPATIEISPTSNNFGSVVKAQRSGYQTFVVTNKGGVASSTPVAAITNDASGSFLLGINTCTTALSPSASCEVQVQFAPADVGTFAGKLEVTAGPLKLSADLSGAGLAPGSLEITPLSQNFDATVIGAKSASITFTVKNAGGAATGTLSGGLTGSATADFPVAANGCANKALAPNETCTIVIQMQPSSAGTRAASLAVSATPGGGVTAQMSGRGLAPAALSLSPAGEAFGRVVTGGSVDKVFTLTNAGDVATGTVGFNVSGAQAGEFTVLAGSPTDCIMGTTKLDANVPSCQLRVRFTPTAVGARTAALSVAAAPGGAKNASLTGTGVAQGQLQANASTRDFGLVEVGNASASFTWKVTNVGGVSTGVPMISANIPAAFLVTNGCMNAIEPNQSCDVSVSFKPTSGGTQNFALTINAIPGGMTQLSMTGRGGYRLTVAATGGGKGTVTSDVPGISCPGTCSAVYGSGAVVNLSAVTENGSDSYFTGFTGAGCQGPGATCNVSISTAPVSVSANFNQLDANLVFVSSESFPPNYESPAKYDAACNDLASKAGINKDNADFVAWISDDTSVAFKRLDGGNGWRRRDGAPVAPSLDALLKNEIWNPILLDEYGNDGGTNAVMTGTNPDGSPGASCKNWSVAETILTPVAGDRTFGPGGWTNGGVGTNCGIRNRIYCFGRSRSVTLGHSGAKGKRVYLSGTVAPGLFTPGGSIADADKICAETAPKGAVAVRALLAQDGRSAAGVINAKEFYVTPSGERVGTGEQILKAALSTGIWETSAGEFATQSLVYTGATTPTAVGDSASTCRNWAGGLLGGALLGSSSSTQATFWNTPTPGKPFPCTAARPIYCVEQ